MRRHLDALQAMAPVDLLRRLVSRKRLRSASIFGAISEALGGHRRSQNSMLEHFFWSFFFGTCFSSRFLEHRKTRMQRNNNFLKNNKHVNFLVKSRFSIKVQRKMEA